MGESHDDVLGELLVDLEELAVIDDACDDLVHIVGLVRVVGDDLVEGVVNPADRIVGREPRSLLHIVLRNIAEEFLDRVDAFLLILGREVSHTALGGVHAGSAEFLLRDNLTEDALHDSRAGEEHVGGVLDHHSEVREGRGVNRSAGARTEYSGNLRDHSGREDIPFEYFPVACERVNSFLDSRSAGVVEADERGTVSGCQIHSLADLLRHSL